MDTDGEETGAASVQERVSFVIDSTTPATRDRAKLTTRGGSPSEIRLDFCSSNKVVRSGGLAGLCLEQARQCRVRCCGVRNLPLLDLIGTS